MHWKNSNFQIKHFIAGKCHTPDEAYRMLLQQHEDRDIAIRNNRAAVLRSEAKMAKARHVLQDEAAEEWERKEAEADIAEIEANLPQGEAVLDQAMKERDYIKSLMDEILPQCVYFGHLEDHEAAQACQQEEWKLELMWRAENFLGSQGMIPHDHLATMRMHPEWAALSGHVQHLLELHQNGKPFDALPDHSSPVAALEDKSTE